MTANLVAEHVSSPIGGDEFRCVLDLVHLSRQTLGDGELERELLELFDRQAANALARLRGPARPNPGSSADIAHMLKGSASAVGAFGVAAAAGSLEQALRNGAPADAPLDALAAAVTEARNTVAALLR